MIAVKAVLLASALGLPLAAMPAARGADSVPADHAALEKRLSAFDPAAVAAVRRYYGSAAVQPASAAMIDNVGRSMLNSIVHQNPEISRRTLGRIQIVLFDALKNHASRIIDRSTLAVLERFPARDIAALDRLDRTVGSAPAPAEIAHLAAQMPEVMREVIPSYLDEIRAELKAENPELNL